MISVSRSRPILGTFVQIKATGDNSTYINSAIDLAFEKIQLVHKLMSVHEMDSEITKLNLTAHLHPVKVHPWLYYVILKSQEISAESNGKFEITIGNILQEYGYIPEYYKTENIKSSDKQVSYQDILLLPDNFILFKIPLTIDLGGIAKGFAVDKAVEELLNLGVLSGIVNAGGDIRVFGRNEEIIKVKVPTNNELLIYLTKICNRSIATSSAHATIKEFQGKKISAIVDGNTKKSFLQPYSISIESDSCMISDALTKVFMTDLYEIEDSEIESGDFDVYSKIIKKYNAKAYIVNNVGEVSVLSE